MKHNVSKILCILLFSILWTAAYGQVPIQKSTEKVRIDGKVYYIHMVKKGETLYSLGKAYEVTVQQITDTNPDVADGLKEGQRIKIPLVENVTAGTPVKNAPDTPLVVEHGTVQQVQAESKKEANQPVYHVVKSGETLYRIAGDYGVTEAELQQLNPDAFLDNKLMTGALLQIPVLKKDVVVIHPTDSLPDILYSEEMLLKPDTLRKKVQPVYLDPVISDDPIRYSSPIKVALILPFMATPEYSEPKDSLAAELPVQRPGNAENFYAFYEGALLAVEQLKRQGLSLQLSVFDNYNEEKMNELLHGGELLGNDIIIGPVYTNSLKPVAQFAREHRIKIISPLDPNAEALTMDNPYFFQVSPPVYCRQKRLIEALLNREEPINIVLVYEEGSRDSLLLENYKDLLGERMEEVKLFSHQVRKGAAVRDSLEVLMSPDTMNCVLIASNDEALVTDITANLYLLTFRQKYAITLYGTERWRNFETIDLTYLHKLNLHLVVPFFVDYKDENVKWFVSEFHTTFKSDPSQYAFQGYDTFYYFIQAVMLYGKDFEKYISYYHPALLQTKYIFKYNESYTNGLVNVESCLIQYTPDYRIEKR